MEKPVSGGKYKMRRRWWKYALVGLVFGIADWYFLDLMASLGRNTALSDQLNQTSGLLRLFAVIFLVGLNYGIWLVPVIPVAIIEMKQSQSIRLAAIASALTWAVAMAGYYGYYAFLLMFVGLPQLDFMLFSNRFSPDYWTNFWPLFRNLILGQFLYWLLIAMGAGSIVGGLSAYLFRRFSSKRRLETIST